MIFSIFRKIAIYFKYKNLTFLKEGKNCQYKFLESKFYSPSKIMLGDFVHLGSGTELHGEGFIEIGNGVIFGPDVIIYTRTHNFDSHDLLALPFDNRILTKKVTILDYVWIGKRVIILPGVTIGKAAVVGAGSVVSKNVPDYAVVVGNPAKIVRYRNTEVVERLLNETDPFVYNKLGHHKIFINKP